MTVVDSFYEYLGYSLCRGFQEVISGFWIPLIVGLCGCVHACIRASERGEPKAIVVYILYLILMVWLLAPVTVRFGNPYIRTKEGVVQNAPDLEVRAPRVLYRANEAIDAAARGAMRHVNGRFSLAPYEWERIARMVQLARIHDFELFFDYRAFLEGCYTRLIARLPEGSDFPDPLDPATARAYEKSDTMVRNGVGTPCARAVDRMRRGLVQHVRSDPRHREILEAARRYDGGEGFLEEYVRTISISEWVSPDFSEAEGTVAVRSVGAPSWLEEKGWSALDPLIPALNPKGAWEFLKDSFGALGRLKQEFAQAQEPRQKHYLVVLYGPHLYGFVIMILIGLFPVVGAWAIVPGGWKALLNFGKVFLSVKLWPLVWAALTQVGAARKSSEAASFDPGIVDMRHVYMVAVAMYLLTPALTFLVVQLATRATAAVVSQAVPATAGPVSPMTVVNVAARGRMHC